MATFGWGPGFDYDLSRLFSPDSAGFGAPYLGGVRRPENVTGDEYGNLWQMQGENRVPWVDPAPVSSAVGIDTPEEYAYALAQPFAGNAEQYRYWLAAHTSPEAAGLWGRMQAGETLSPGMRAALEHPDKLGQDLLRTGLPWDAWAAPSSTDNPAAQQAILDKYPGLVPDERASAWAANNTAAAQAARDDDGLRQLLPALAVLGMPFALQGLTGLLGLGEAGGLGALDTAFMEGMGGLPGAEAAAGAAGAGADVLSGSGGKELLVGEAANDTLSFGAKNMDFWDLVNMTGSQGGGLPGGVMDWANTIAAGGDIALPGVTTGVGAGLGLGLEGGLSLGDIAANLGNTSWLDKVVRTLSSTMSGSGGQPTGTGGVNLRDLLGLGGGTGGGDPLMYALLGGLLGGLGSRNVEPEVTSREPAGPIQAAINQQLSNLGNLPTSLSLSPVPAPDRLAPTLDHTYTQQYIDAMLRPITQNYREQVMPAIGMGAVDAGGYGGSRQGTAEGLASRSYLDTVSDATSKMQEALFAQNIGYMLNANKLNNAAMLDASKLNLAREEAMGKFPLLSAQTQANATSAFGNNWYTQTKAPPTANPWLGALGGALTGGQVWGLLNPQRGQTQQPAGMPGSGSTRAPLIYDNVRYSIDPVER